jgi:PRA1 family protein
MSTSPDTTPRSMLDIEALRLHVSSFVARLKSNVSLDTLRPLPIFLGLSSTVDDGVHLASDAFTPPLAGSGTMTMIRSRVQDNWTFFLSNYALLAAMTALVVLLMHPGVVVVLAIICGLWWCHGYLIKHELVVFGVQIHTLLTVQQRFYLLFAISTVVLLWYGFFPTIVFVMISGFIILCHASLRDTSHLHEASQRGSKHRRDNVDNEAEALISKV